MRCPRKFRIRGFQPPLFPVHQDGKGSRSERSSKTICQANRGRILSRHHRKGLYRLCGSLSAEQPYTEVCEATVRLVRQKRWFRVFRQETCNSNNDSHQGYKWSRFGSQGRNGGKERSADTCRDRSDLQGP